MVSKTWILFSESTSRVIRLMWLCSTDDQLLKLVGDLLVGGTETTGTTLRWLIIFLVRWPHVQRKMRQEIDSVYPDKTTPSVKVR